MIGYRRLRFVLVPLVLLGLFLAEGCHPLSTNSRKWRIEWDPEMLQGKADYAARTAPKRTPGERPSNIVILLCDDLGKNEVSAYGNSPVPTPHLDQLGQEGVVFEEGYVTSPTCAPSRAGILTGRMQNRCGFETQANEVYPHNILSYAIGKRIIRNEEFVLDTKPDYPSEKQIKKQGLPISEINLAEALKLQGYVTGITGKWHLGQSEEQDPLLRGFDYQYGFKGAFSWYTPEKEWPGVVNYVHDIYSARYQWKTGRKGSHAIRENGVLQREDQYLTFAIRDKAIDFMEQHQEEPFFLYCAFNAPHIPFQAPQEYYDRFAHVKDESKRVYYAMIAAVDAAIGGIHQSIKDLGLAENTLIYFLSDNGGATYTGATENGDLKGGKFTHFEGGVNVPFMLKWQGRIPGGQRYAPPVSATDIFPTSLLQAGGQLPQDRVYDGVDLLPYLTGQDTSRPHPALFWRADHVWALRDGDFKLILSTRDGWAELYNIAEDKSERYNLKTQFPDLFQTLYQKHLDWQEELPEKYLWPRLVDYRFLIDGKMYYFPS